jgi:hypothetical protein
MPHLDDISGWLIADDAGREVACWHVDRVLAGEPTEVGS